MIDDEKLTLLTRVKFGYVIKDPFPEHTQVEIEQGMLKEIGSFFKFRARVKPHARPKEINIWQAYKMGEDAAIRRLEEALK